MKEIVEQFRRNQTAENAFQDGFATVGVTRLRPG
jgi:hypothetical protein